MPSLIIDDANTTLIQYVGNWQQVPGSTRQWEGGVHVTGELGAKATFGFRGYSLKMWGTIPAGTGSSLVDISLDGGKPTVSSKTSNGSAVYDEVFYDSGLLGETFHTVVITNRGSTSDGYTEFMLDRFQFETTDEVPLFPTLSAPTGNSSPTTNPTGGNQGSTSKPNNTPLIATGVVVGVLAIGLAIFAIFLLKTRRQLNQFRKGNLAEKGKDATGGDPSIPVPFPTATSTASDPSNPSNATTGLQSPDAQSPMSEKAALRSARSNTTMSPSVSALPISATDTNFSSSSRLNLPSVHNFSEVGSHGSASTAPSNVARSEISTTPLLSQTPASGSGGGKGEVLPVPVPIQEETSQARAHASSQYDNPPPSYWTQSEQPR
ncbi:hypothetical protein BJ165DRAFT_1509915 [Panaeolus papilionaceus]|nr:hypothetical protein BJ165DRAFT_1509915 [Panaeolus papilionaceus]